MLTFPKANKYKQRPEKHWTQRKLAHLVKQIKTECKNTLFTPRGFTKCSWGHAVIWTCFIKGLTWPLLVNNSVFQGCHLYTQLCYYLFIPIYLLSICQKGLANCLILYYLCFTRYLKISLESGLYVLSTCVFLSVFRQLYHSALSKVHFN